MNMRGSGESGSNGSPVKIYLNRPSPCPYLPHREEQRLLVPLAHEPDLAHEQIGFFTQLGFRRSQNVMYRPQCPGCTACISYRVRAADFAPSATQLRTIRRNAALTWREIDLHTAADTLYPMFRAYQQARHTESDMAKFSADDFQSLLTPAAPGNVCFVLHDPAEGRDLAAILVDRTVDGLSAVYSFYWPDQPQRSLGTAMVLRLIEQATRESLPFVYLGYWVEDCSKMSYKKNFQPAEILGPDGWIGFTA